MRLAQYLAASRPIPPRPTGRRTIWKRDQAAMRALVEGTAPVTFLHRGWTIRREVAPLFPDLAWWFQAPDYDPESACDETCGHAPTEQAAVAEVDRLLAGVCDHCLRDDDHAQITDGLCWRCRVHASEY